MIPSTIDEACAQIDSLAKLAHGWNSHQAAAIAYDAMYMAKQIVQRSGSVPNGIVPTSTGGVQLEWHRGGVDLEIEIHPDYSLSYLMEGELSTLAVVTALIRQIGESPP